MAPVVLYAAVKNGTYSGATDERRLADSGVDGFGTSLSVGTVNIHDLVILFLLSSGEGEGDLDQSLGSGLKEVIVRSPIPPFHKIPGPEKHLWVARLAENKDSADFSPSDYVVHAIEGDGSFYSGAAQGYIVGEVVIGGTGIGPADDVVVAAAIEDTEPSASTTITFPDFTTPIDDCLVILFAMGNTTGAGAGTTSSAWTNANLTGLTKLVDGSTSTGNDRVMSIAAGVKATAGAIGTTTATWSQSARASYGIVAVKNAPTSEFANTKGWMVGETLIPAND